MIWNQLFAKKTLEMLDEEAKGENRLRRVLGPIALTSLGVGAIIGAGIFVMTGRTAAVDAGPAVILSYVVAGVGCALAALCYAEFASTAPVAGSAYTYAYATLGEVFAWIIGWDLVLEYAMACAVVAAGWTQYLDEFMHTLFHVHLPAQIMSDPFTQPGAWFNLPAVLVLAAVTVVLVIGIRESATFNAGLVMVKVGVVLFVIFAGLAFINPANWTDVPVTDRLTPEAILIPPTVQKDVKEGKLTPAEAEHRVRLIRDEVMALYQQKGKLTEEAARKRADQISTQVEELYEETAKLPDKVAAARVQKLTGAALAVYRIERRLSSDEISKEEAQAAIDETLAEYEAVYKIRVKQIDNQVPAEQADKEYEKLLHEVEKAASVRQKLLASQIPEAQGKADLAAAKSEIAAAAARYRIGKISIAGDQRVIDSLLAKVGEEAPSEATKKWGLLGWLGINRWLVPIDEGVRSPFAPYGLSGIMLGAALVFFAYIGFDSISTHAEEARLPQRDVPIGILASLGVCTVLYIAVSAVITGMEPYPEIDRTAAVAAAFRHQAEQPGQQHSGLLNASAGLIATGALAGLTSVLLITFLSQARIFLAMARDGLLPPRIFGAIHAKFRTPHISTMLTGGIICVVAAFTPIGDLEEMVNIGTLMAFVIVCAAVLILRLKRPDAHRPFRCPLVYVVAPLGIAVNLLMMLFLPPVTWLRLVGWLAVGMFIYFGYGVSHSRLGQLLRGRQKEELALSGASLNSNDK